MFGFLNINMRNFPKNNTAIIHQAVDKMHKGNLNVSEILDSDELITDIKSSMSQIGSYFSNSQNVKDLINYIIKEPTEDEHKRGHKFPFNACEILCSENQSILKKIFDENKNEDEEDIETGKKDLDQSDYKKKNNDDDEDFDIDFSEMENNKKEDDVDLISDKNNFLDNNNNTNKDIEINDNKFTFDDVTNDNNLNSNFELKERSDEDIVNFNDNDKDNNNDVTSFDEKANSLEKELNDLNINEEKETSDENKLSNNIDNDIEMCDNEKKNNPNKIINDDIQNNYKDNNKQELMNKVNNIVHEVKNNIKFNDVKQADEDEKDVMEDAISPISDIKEQENEDDIIKNSINNNINKEYTDNQKDSLNVSLGENKFDTEILDYFFSFLDTDKELNFVLCGYFAKIFGHFLNLRQSIIIKYLFIQKPEVLKSFAKHTNRKSIVECIYKILISYSEDVPDSMNLKIEFLKEVLDKFNSQDDDVIYNISDMIVELFTVRKMYLTFITNNDVFQTIFDFVINNINNKSFIYLIKILQKANENILKDFGNNIVTPTFTCNETQEMFFNFTYNVNNLISGNAAYNSQADNTDENAVNVSTLKSQFNNIFLTLTNATEKVLNNFVENCIKEEDNKEETAYFESTYSRYQPILGIRRLNEIEYFRTILEILVNACANNTILENINLDIIVDKLVSSNFFSYALVSLNIFKIFIYFNYIRNCYLSIL